VTKVETVRYSPFWIICVPGNKRRRPDATGRTIKRLSITMHWTKSGGGGGGGGRNEGTIADWFCKNGRQT
jgi:hypothetical protein